MQVDPPRTRQTGKQAVKRAQLGWLEFDRVASRTLVFSPNQLGRRIWPVPAGWYAFCFPCLRFFLHRSSSPATRRNLLSAPEIRLAAQFMLTCVRKTSTFDGRVALLACSAVMNKSKSFATVSTFSSPLRFLSTPIAPCFNASPPFGLIQTR